MNERKILAGKHSRLELRARVIDGLRRWFRDAGFLEVTTPVRTPAPAPEVHIDAIPADGWFLSTSPELYMKRLLAAGYPRLFQIAPAFRRGERGRRHHPEFTLLEWYRPGADYAALMRDCEAIVAAAREAAGRPGGWEYRGQWLESDVPWPRLTVREAFRLHAGWEPGADPNPDRFDEDLVTLVEPRLGFPRPTILHEYPASQAALARLKPGDPSVAERFELYWAGVELANGFSELTDADEQRHRFEADRGERRRRGLNVYPSPDAFLEALRDLGPCAGIAMGVDRLVMLLAGAESIDEVVAFPPEDA